MSLILSDYAYDDQGNAIVGATVEAYVTGTGTPVSSTTTDSNGLWTIAGLPAGPYDVKIYKGTQVRWLRGAVAFQATTIYGANGIDAPLADASIKTSQIQNDAVDATKIADNSITDAILGFRTVNDATAPTLDTDILTTHLSGLANRIKAITGAAGWKSGPAATISNINTRVTAIEGLLGHQVAALAADYTVVSQTAWEDIGLSLSLTAGTWIVLGTFAVTTTGSVTGVQITNGTATYVSGDINVPASQIGSLTLSTVVTLAATTTVKVQAHRTNVTNTTKFYAAETFSGSNATQLAAIHIA